MHIALFGNSAQNLKYPANPERRASDALLCNKPVGTLALRRQDITGTAKTSRPWSAANCRRDESTTGLTCFDYHSRHRKSGNMRLRGGKFDASGGVPGA